MTPTFDITPTSRRPRSNDPRATHLSNDQGKKDVKQRRERCTGDHAGPSRRVTFVRRDGFHFMAETNSRTVETVRPRKRMVINITFQEEGERRAHVMLDSARGQEIFVEGPLYPREWSMINLILGATRDLKDQFPPARKAVTE